MPRPKRCRKVCCDPGHRYFKPQGIPLSELRTRELGLDELESVRLSDLLGLSQTESAKSMGISQPTFNRILAEARGKIAECLVEGCALRIGSSDGDGIAVASPESNREGCSRRRVRGRGRN